MIVRSGFWCIDVGLYVLDGDWRMNYSRRRIFYVWVFGNVEFGDFVFLTGF